MWEIQHNNADKDCFKTLICKRPRRLEVNIRKNFVHFRKSHVRASKLDVQETDLSGHTTNQTNPKMDYEETRGVMPHQTSTPRIKPRQQPSTTLLN